MSGMPGLVTHIGGCHCGAVRWEFDATPHITIWDCNCSICNMKKNTHLIIPASRFRLTQGEDKLTLYQFKHQASKALILQCLRSAIVLHSTLQSRWSCHHGGLYHIAHFGDHQAHTNRWT
eukprot:jgi/Botrbrau1/6028/Bobra.0042s0014.2